MDLTGIHHVTAITGAIRHNLRFYTGVLGRRLVKRSVNQDDVSAYHLFYADGVGSPGTDLTFFDWPLPRERRGTRSIVRTHLRVTGERALSWWADRLRSHDVRTGAIVERDGRLTLDFEDGEGQRLSLIDDGGAGDPPAVWSQSPVPADYQIRGLGPVVISVPTLDGTVSLIEGVLNMRPVREYADPEHGERAVRVYEMGAGGPHAELHIAVQPDLPAATQGAGGVHHVAFRTPDEEQYRRWAERLAASRIPNSGPIDRYYFRSLYLREPNGILFEIATDGPGFTVDEDPDHLGERVALPPFLEPQRPEILARLQPLS